MGAAIRNVFGEGEEMIIVVVGKLQGQVYLTETFLFHSL